MFNFTYITPEKAAELGVINEITDVNYYRELAQKEGACEVCGNPIWKIADTGMCFSCTTGETDASDDYELKGE